MMTKAERVHEIVKECLFRNEELVDGEAPSDAVLVEGILHRFGFHPGRLERMKDAIRGLLLQMPEEFFITAEGGGGGWSFLQLCMDRDGVHWAEHSTMDELVCLGLGAGMAKFCIEDREMWKAFPGAVPYIVFAGQQKGLEG